MQCTDIVSNIFQIQEKIFPFFWWHSHGRLVHRLVNHGRSIYELTTRKYWVKRWLRLGQISLRIYNQPIVVEKWRRRRIEQFNIFIISVRGSSPGHNIPTLMDLLEPGHFWGVRLEGFPPPSTLQYLCGKYWGLNVTGLFDTLLKVMKTFENILYFWTRAGPHQPYSPQPGLPCSRPQSNLNNLIPAQAYKAGLHCTDAEYLIKLPAIVSGPHSQISWQTITTVRWTEPWCSGASDNTITLLSTLFVYQWNFPLQRFSLQSLLYDVARPPVCSVSLTPSFILDSYCHSPLPS